MSPAAGYAFLFLTAFLSGLLVYLFRFKRNTLKLILAFTGAYIFALAVLHLLPELYEKAGSPVGIYILAGFFLQILIEFFSEGIEHGHIHVHKERGLNFPFAVILGLSIHSILEGMPLVREVDGNTQLNKALLIGIVLHNMPIAVSLMSMCLESGLKRRLSLLLLFIFSLCAPAGALLSSSLEGILSGSLAYFHNSIMGIVIGILLHISTIILFEANENHRFNLMKLLVIILGAFAAFLIA